MTPSAEGCEPAGSSAGLSRSSSPPQPLAQAEPSEEQAVPLGWLSSLLCPRSPEPCWGPPGFDSLSPLDGSGCLYAKLEPGSGAVLWVRTAKPVACAMPPRECLAIPSPDTKSYLNPTCAVPLLGWMSAVEYLCLGVLLGTFQ